MATVRKPTAAELRKQIDDLELNLKIAELDEGIAGAVKKFRERAKNETQAILLEQKLEQLQAERTDMLEKISKLRDQPLPTQRRQGAPSGPAQPATSPSSTSQGNHQQQHTTPPPQKGFLEGLNIFKR